MGEDADVENTTDPGFGTDGIVILGDGDCANPSSKAGTGAAVGVSATAAMKRAGSGLSLSHPEQAESFPVLFEICGRVVVDFVLLQKGVHLHSRFETEQPTKLGGSERVRPVCFKCQAFKRGARQVLPFAFQPVCDVFRQFQLNLHRRTPFNPLSQDALSSAAQYARGTSLDV
jgi:hypothetical protein